MKDQYVDDRIMAVMRSATKIMRESFGVHESDAAAVAEKIIIALGEHFTDIQARDIKAVRNAAIVREFNGRNYGDLARDHGLAEITVWKIINAPRQ